MARTGIISTIKREFSGGAETMERSLSQKGLTRTPGTGVFKFPYKELDGKYRTGLDADASYIKRIKDETERELETERVKKLRVKLEGVLQVDLGPKSDFWNFGKATDPNDEKHVKAVKLIDGKNYFDLDNPIQELTFAWLRVHPTIASSFQAWERGEYAAETQFYVVDDEIENAVKYKKKQDINKAIAILQSMAPSLMRKVARQLELPVTEDTKEEVVYNLIDDKLKQTEFKNGKHSGLNPVRVFLQYATMKEDLLHVKDLVKQAIQHSIYRIKNGGKIYKGENELAKSEEDLVKYLMDDNNQDDLLTLEDELKSKKLASV